MNKQPTVKAVLHEVTVIATTLAIPSIPELHKEFEAWVKKAYGDMKVLELESNYGGQGQEEALEKTIRRFASKRIWPDLKDEFFRNNDGGPAQSFFQIRPDTQVIFTDYVVAEMKRKALPYLVHDIRKRKQRLPTATYTECLGFSLRSYYNDLFDLIGNIREQLTDLVTIKLLEKKPKIRA
jgi:hypothetical protein